MDTYPNEDIVDVMRFSRGLRALLDAANTGDRDARKAILDLFSTFDEIESKVKVIAVATDYLGPKRH